ncbi:cytochrome P450 [Aspergillus ustus]|uniref:Cytochrome P450 n=1 Tax=Aspergillus ustus TaxID=40382 RepID=A0A0C1E6D7_ASPUT|nr:cytochrome P450 [Aspergillus ustus]
MDVRFFAGKIASIAVQAVGIAFAVGVFYVDTILAECLYRVTFHPYAKYPGPFLAKFTNAYAAYHSWKGDLHVDIWRCHEIYGDRVRYAPDRLLINTAEALRDIYASDKTVTKSRAYEAVMPRSVANTMTLRNKKEHARRRRILAVGFSDQAIRSYEGKARVIVQRFCAALSPAADAPGNWNAMQWSSPRNLAPWCNYVFFDLANDIIFGQDWNCLEKAENREVIDAIPISNIRAGVLSNAPEIRWKRCDKRFFIPSIIARGKFIMFIRATVQKKMSETEKKPDIFSTLVHSRDETTGTQLSQAELAAETANLISAGSDTSSTTLSALFFYLSRYPEAYNKAATEVRRTFPSPDTVTLGPSLNSCTYLRACLDEALRMAPAVASAPWREATRPAGALIDGCFIPPGYDVGLGIYSIHHSERYFEDPFVFRPERWIVGDNESDPTGSATSKATIDRARSAFNPFSVGPRSCIGKALATAEIMFIMARVLSEFDFRKVEGPLGNLGEGDPVAGEYGHHRPEEFQMIDHVICAKEGPVLQFRSRVGVDV